MSSINIKFEVMPFAVPSEVVAIPEHRVRGKSHKLNFELSQISPDQLAKLCDDFRASVFEKACVADPAKYNPCVDLNAQGRSKTYPFDEPDPRVRNTLHFPKPHDQPDLSIEAQR